MKNISVSDILTPRLKLNKYIPRKPTIKQTALMLLNEFKEVFFGGAAGGAKSEGLLMAGAQYLTEPNYDAVVFRRTYAELSKPGALLDRSHDWWYGTDAHWDGTKKQWRFPSGATFNFDYLDHENDKRKQKSAEYNFIAFDELSEFPESFYTFMFSRLRKGANCFIPSRIRSASNPGGIGHEWVKRRFITARAPGVFFLPSYLSDNPFLNYDDYVDSLKNLDPVNYERLLHGDWDIAETGGMFETAWFEIIDVAPADIVTRVRFWDLAATEKKRDNDPDYTAGVLLGRDSRGLFYVLDVQRFRETPREVEKRIVNIASQDGKNTYIAMEKEPGASGVALADSYHRALAEYAFYSIPSTGSKVARATPISAQAQAGNVKIVSGGTNVNEFLAELQLFPLGAHDDQVDALSGAYNFMFNCGLPTLDFI